MAVRTDFVAGEVLAAQDLDDTFAAKIDYATPVNTQTGTTYTFVLADGLRLTTANNAAASTFTVPPQSSVVWLANSIIRLVNLGAGAVTINGGSGVTVTNTAATVAQFQSVDCIRTGSDAWTVVVAGGGDEPGLVHINTTTFSAVSSVSIDNVFNATHDNYFINFFMSVAAGSPNLDLRLRVGGVDVTASNYTRQILAADGAATSAAKLTTTSFRLGGVSVDSITTGQINIFRPAIAAKTGYNAFEDGAAGSANLNLLVGSHSLSTAHDGFTVFPATSTITGTLRVYGYRNS